jgi:hypothetical protein
MLCTVCCVLPNCVLRTAYSLLHAVCTAALYVHSACCIRHASLLSTLCPVRRILTVYCVYCILRAGYCTLRILHTLYLVPRTAYCVLSQGVCLEEHASRSASCSRLPRGCFEVAVPRPARPACPARFSVRAFSPSKHTPVGVCF